MKPIYLIYLILINIFAVIITCYDKYCAIRRKWRVKESTLLLVSFLGGSIFMYLTMHIIRHKTNHLKFMFIIPVTILLQSFILFSLLR